ncbi:hypothetical protein [Insulibacter thermoxylanivorax]|uniref:hypothetical protein n=1 Tax=Insulibacter thermoxylanivorax TaxID=2749268 RepID=UPI00190FE3C6|nr:hypothetical protein [Insulibacter thermoxylanivorax]
MNKQPQNNSNLPDRRGKTNLLLKPIYLTKGDNDERDSMYQYCSQKSRRYRRHPGLHHFMHHLGPHAAHHWTNVTVHVGGVIHSAVIMHPNEFIIHLEFMIECGVFVVLETNIHQLR